MQTTQASVIPSTLFESPSVTDLVAIFNAQRALHDFEDFWRHVMGGAQDGRPFVHSRLEDAGDAKVAQLDPAILTDKNVRR